MKGRFFLIVCLIVALYLAFVFANYNQHYHFTLPTFNLKSVSALAASINQAQPQAAQASTGSYSVVGSPTIRPLSVFLTVGYNVRYKYTYIALLSIFPRS